MPDFTSLLQQYNNLENATLELLPGSSSEESYKVYRIQRADGKNFLARFYRYDKPLLAYFYSYTPATASISEWLETRAATLNYLEQLDYPAPRVERNRVGASVGIIPEWCGLITSFIQGNQLKPTLEQLRLLGAALGSLHAISSNQSALLYSSPGKSYWNPENVYSAVKKQLDEVANLLPDEMRALHAGFLQTIQELSQLKELPQAVIHGDAWPANAIQAPGEKVILVDWDTGGLGTAIFDLGRLLLECHLDSNFPLNNPRAWLIRPDEARIRAVVAGYTQQRKLNKLELDNLLYALRFGTVYIGALHFKQVVQTKNFTPEWENGMLQRLTRLQNRWDVSEEIALLSLKHFKMEEQ